MYQKMTTEEVKIVMCVEDLCYSISASKGVVWDNAHNEEISFMESILGSEITNILLFYVKGIVHGKSELKEIFSIDISHDAEDDGILDITIEIQKKEYDLIYVTFSWVNQTEEANK